MAEIVERIGSPIVLAGSGWGSGYHGFGPANYSLTLQSLAAGRMRSSQKIDLGENLAPRYVVRIGIKFDTAPTAGEPVIVYWSASNSSVADTGNDGGHDGTDSLIPSGTEAAMSYLLRGIGTVAVQASTNYQLKTIATTWSIPSRYGSIIVWNNTSQAFANAVDLFVALIPVRTIII